MLFFHGSSLLLMFFGLGIFGQLCAELSLIVWFEWGMRGGFFVASLFLVSFRDRYCECLSCLSTIYLLWVLDTFASPTSPSTSSLNLSGHSADRAILWQAKLFVFKELWANQCTCCTPDRFSPNSTGAKLDCHLNIPSWLTWSSVIISWAHME